MEKRSIKGRKGSLGKRPVCVIYFWSKCCCWWHEAIIAIELPGTPVIQKVDGVSQWIHWCQVDKHSCKLLSYAGDSAIHLVNDRRVVFGYYFFFLVGSSFFVSSGGIVVRAPMWPRAPRLGIIQHDICGLSLLILSSTLRGFSSVTLAFPSTKKPSCDQIYFSLQCPQ